MSEGGRFWKENSEGLSVFFFVISVCGELVIDSSSQSWPTRGRPLSPSGVVGAFLWHRCVEMLLLHSSLLSNSATGTRARESSH